MFGRGTLDAYNWTPTTVGATQEDHNVRTVVTCSYLSGVKNVYTAHLGRSYMAASHPYLIL